MANRIPSEQTLVVSGVPEERRGMIVDALNIQSVIEAPVLQSSRSNLMGPLMTVQDRTPSPAPRYLIYANFRDALTCMIAFDNFERWLLTRDWAHEVTAYIKSNGPPAVRVMVPPDQTLVIKAVPEDKKELVLQALQIHTIGMIGVPNSVPDKTNLMAQYGGPATYVMYINYLDAQRCVEAVVNMESWLRSQGEWGQQLNLSVKLLSTKSNLE